MELFEGDTKHTCYQWACIGNISSSRSGVQEDTSQVDKAGEKEEIS